MPNGPQEARSSHLVAAVSRLTGLMVGPRFNLSTNGSLFHREGGYSERAAIPEEGEAEGLLSPVRYRVISPEAYRRDLPCPRARTPWDFHRSIPSAVMSRRRHQAPLGADKANRISEVEKHDECSGASD